MALLITSGSGCVKGQLLNPGNAMIPSIETVVPSIGVVTGGTKISIHGSGFVAGGSVTLGTSPCSEVELVTSSQITCITPENQPGPANVSVSNPNHKTTVLTKGFVYTESASAVPGHALVSGGSVTVKGSDRIQIVTVGEIGGPVLQTTSRRLATIGIQAVLSGN